MPKTTPRSSRRALAAIPAFALTATGLAALAPITTTAAPAQAATISADEAYMNYSEPRADALFGDDVAVGGEASAMRHEALRRAQAVDARFSEGNPIAAKGLAELEAKAIETGKSPKTLKLEAGAAPEAGMQSLEASEYSQADSRHEAKLLTILVEFNEEADDDFSGVQVPTAFGSTTCQPGTVQNGPLHNAIPNPADAALPDNNSMWVKDFSPKHFEQMLFTKQGITKRVRTDLTGPDGKRGFDISGYSMANMYQEMSHGAYTVSGTPTQWVTVPHSEAYYGASTCSQNERGEWVAGALQDMQGHPDNPRGARQLPIDAVAALAEADPDFPWWDYDREDLGDRDGDGDFFEPDGVIDHVVLVHAGKDKSSGGGAQGSNAIWAHSSAVPGGADIPGTDLKLSNYIVQPEDAGVGVFAHEYGHDLGLPDLYDTSGAGRSDVDFWDLMASGSHAGPIYQSMPTHMGLWDKWVLGWADPVEVNPGDEPLDVVVGQNSRPKRGTEDGIIVNLPDKEIRLTTPHSGDNAWYTGDDQAWADLRLSRTFDDVPADAKFWMWNDYVIEQDWDYGFVEISTDGGTTWKDVKVYNEDGSEATTGDDYADPNGNLRRGFQLNYGLTGTSHGWKHQYVDLSAYAGQSIGVRLRMATDAVQQERGWFADDFALTSGDEVIWSDDVEAGDNNWKLEVASWNGTTGPGWRINSGVERQAQYYLVEWRNLDGFDKGLAHAYTSVYSGDSWKVNRIPYNAPGALVWYRDTTYGELNHVRGATTVLPSAGAKGGLLIVDSHFDPLRRTGEGADHDPSALKNMPSAIQSSDAAFGMEPTPAFHECFAVPGVINHHEYCTKVAERAPVARFTDDQGWAPGIEYRPDLLPITGQDLFHRYLDGSTVVPSVGNAPYSTRVVNADGTPATELYGIDVGFTTLGSGNPADDEVSFGTAIEVVETQKNNTSAVIRVTPPSAE